MSKGEQKEGRQVSPMLADAPRQLHPERHGPEADEKEKGQHVDRLILGIEHVRNEEDVERRGDVEPDGADHEGKDQPLEGAVCPHQLEALDHGHRGLVAYLRLRGFEKREEYAHGHQHEHGGAHQGQHHVAAAQAEKQQSAGGNELRAEAAEHAGHGPAARDP